MIKSAHAIMVDRASTDQINAVHQIVKENANGWWHQFANVWLVGGEKTASEWRDLLKESLSTGGASFLVLRLPPQTAERKWAFFGTQAKDRAAWFHKNYKS